MFNRNTFSISAEIIPQQWICLHQTNLPSFAHSPYYPLSFPSLLVLKSLVHTIRWKIGTYLLSHLIIHRSSLLSRIVSKSDALMIDESTGTMHRLDCSTNDRPRQIVCYLFNWSAKYSLSSKIFLCCVLTKCSIVKRVLLTILNNILASQIIVFHQEIEDWCASLCSLLVALLYSFHITLEELSCLMICSQRIPR